MNPSSGWNRRLRPRGRIVAIAAVLVGAVIVAFLPLRESGFINFDDDKYLIENYRVTAGLTIVGMRWAFTTLAGGNWHPLAWISHQLDWQLYEGQPRGHHRTNLLIHAVNSLLLFGLLLRLTAAFWRSALVAALFALHPLHVESVAWVSERKDLLCGFFWLLALLAYRRYAARPSPGRYGVVLGAFALSLMAKPMAMTLPFVLLLLDYWPLGRQGRGRGWAFLAVEKTPFFLIAGAIAVVSLSAQRAAGAAEFGQSLPVMLRIGNAFLSYAAYLGQTFWPARLAVFYPHPASLAPAVVLSCALLIALVSTAGVALRRQRPFLLVGWLWFVGTLVPVIGLVQVGHQARADRYTYLPLIGLFLALAWGWGVVVGGRAKASFAAGAAAVFVLAALGIVTFRQTGFWRSSRTLFEHALAVTENNVVAHNNLGLALLLAGQPAAARPHFEAALRLNPGHYPAQANMGLVIMEEGKPEEAAGYFRTLLQTHPLDFRLHNGLGNALFKTGRIREAIQCYRLALIISPNNTEVRGNLLRAEALAASVAPPRPAR